MTEFNTTTDSIFAAIDKSPVSFVLPTGILQENIACIDEAEEHVVYTMRVPAPRLDDAGLRALSHDDELGKKFAAFLAARVRRLAKNRGTS